MLETAPRPPGLNTDLVDLEFQDWGVVEYEEALARQLKLVDEVAEGRNGVLVFCTHPAVVTLGRATQASDVFAWQGPTIEISRGGRATYHGPSQLVVYPIVNLKNPRKGRGPQEIHGFLRELEDGIVEVLAQKGLSAVGKSLQKKSSTDAGADETGVWVGHRKVASLGLGIKKWVTYHGAAINLDADPKAFFGMNPCGFQRDVMVSLQDLLGHPIDRADFSTSLRQVLLRRL